MTFEVTFRKHNSDIFSANIVKAESEEIARNHYNSEKYEVVGCKPFNGFIKPGQPVINLM